MLSKTRENVNRRHSLVLTDIQNAAKFSYSSFPTTSMPTIYRIFVGWITSSHWTGVQEIPRQHFTNVCIIVSTPSETIKSTSPDVFKPTSAGFYLPLVSCQLPLRLSHVISPLFPHDGPATPAEVPEGTTQDERKWVINLPTLLKPTSAQWSAVYFRPTTRV
ncbi:hypothetical protein AVEN_169602-1 [Araneus ventricosus]|uniref:Uncharacterized protein n=1 Tax=Araneus ventricosus TaxID=182803 RepID=A0A4Y2HQ21_ARAVE|nr:hypothetical protein AVEN_169602-1 [Araneus ventricosus]